MMARLHHLVKVRCGWPCGILQPPLAQRGACPVSTSKQVALTVIPTVDSWRRSRADLSYQWTTFCWRYLCNHYKLLEILETSLVSSIVACCETPYSHKAAECTVTCHTFKDGFSTRNLSSLGSSACISIWSSKIPTLSSLGQKRSWDFAKDKKHILKSLARCPIDIL